MENFLTRITEDFMQASDKADMFDELVAGFKLIAHNANVYEKQARENGDLVAALMGLEIVRKHSEEYVKKAEE